MPAYHNTPTPLQADSPWAAAIGKGADGRGALGILGGLDTLSNSRGLCEGLTERLSLAAALCRRLCLGQHVGHGTTAAGGDSGGQRRREGLRLSATRGQGLMSLF